MGGGLGVGSWLSEMDVGGGDLLEAQLCEETQRNETLPGLQLVGGWCALMPRSVSHHQRAIVCTDFDGLD